MKHKIMVALLVILCSVSGSPQSGKEQTAAGVSHRQRIKELEEELRQATLKNDPEATDRLLADDWVNTNANGSVTSKRELLALLKSSPFKFQSIEDEEVVIRVYGGSAVVTGRSTRKRLAPDNNVVAQQVRFTRVYALQDSGWRVVAAQATPVAQR